MGLGRLAPSLHSSAPAVARRSLNSCHTPSGTELNKLVVGTGRFETNGENQFIEWSHDRRKGKILLYNSSQPKDKIKCKRAVLSKNYLLH